MKNTNREEIRREFQRLKNRLERVRRSKPEFNRRQYVRTANGMISVYEVGKDFVRLIKRIDNLKHKSKAIKELRKSIIKYCERNNLITHSKMSPELRRSLMATLCGSGLLTVSLLLLTEKIGHDLMKGLGGKVKERT